MSDSAEGQVIADAKAAQIAGLSWEELDAYATHVETVSAPSGRTYRVNSSARWDMDAWASGMNIHVKVYAPIGLRRIWGYKAWKARGGPNDLVPEPPGP